MQAQEGSEATLSAIVAAATDMVPGARWAGISLIQKGQIVHAVPTDPIVAKLDELQSELGAGPCITALRKHHTVRIDDMSTETRWPQFCRQAAELGVHSLLSFQLFVRSQNLGALNLYAAETHVFSDESTEIGTILAQHAAVAIIGVANLNQFKSAVASRDIIGQAKGILMERLNTDADQAFALLLGVSQDTNTKLVEVARFVVADRGDTSLRPPKDLPARPGCRHLRAALPDTDSEPARPRRTR
ncbi:GAF and ANTAR domain-containing protein [Mycolicibacterium tusciae]|uniref:Response regulator receiver protein n=1 Tax=Mycolicibacterium tusciae TaxID=75922 RepID=A0A1X0JXQ5_9MYCO|nr:GAF and ANTAR domain-containing protein [Mycolicibacterium tusciae]ORB67688.1 response regulator receiver protein [Mycolicibacterium tusciae]